MKKEKTKWKWKKAETRHPKIMLRTWRGTLALRHAAIILIFFSLIGLCNFHYAISLFDQTGVVFRFQTFFLHLRLGWWKKLHEITEHWYSHQWLPRPISFRPCFFISVVWIDSMTHPKKKWKLDVNSFSFWTRRIKFTLLDTSWPLRQILCFLLPLVCLESRKVLIFYINAYETGRQTIISNWNSWSLLPTARAGPESATKIYQ